jgi:hypothetical protein
MNPRPTRTHYADAVAGAVLITLGTLGLVVRLGWLTIATLPPAVQQWWPLLLIVVGVALWAVEQEPRVKSRTRREANYVL